MAKNTPKNAKNIDKVMANTDSKTATPKADRHMADVPASERKKELVKLLRKLKADSPTRARTLTDLVMKTGWTRFDVYGCINGTSGKAGSSPSCLAATGHVATTVLEEGGLAVYLTALGKSTKFDDRPFARPAKKSE